MEVRTNPKRSPYAPEPIRSPEDVRLLKHFQRFCNLQRNEILELRTALYKAEARLQRFEPGH